MVSRLIPVEDFDLVIFGGTGDLARRKILPGLYRRFRAGQMSPTSRIIGSGRRDLSAADYQARIEGALKEFLDASDWDSDSVAEFLKTIDYVRIDAGKGEGWDGLKDHLRPSSIRAFYFSVAPSLFGVLAENLHRSACVGPHCRIVVEKPFGRDLASAQELNQSLAGNFSESQIYRIDHYLGKETVQNLMVVRFGNTLFEPLWNAQYVDHVQITVAETVGVGGRGEYYDRSGAMRDMVQNHLMQLLCLIAMEPPSRFTPDAVRDEKLKVIRALDPVEAGDIVRGQYASGPEGPGYRDEVGNPESLTESYLAMKLGISNWRWKGTPFYIRTGKRLSARASEIAVVFKDAPHSIFPQDGETHANILTIRLQPNEGIQLGVTIKEPGPGGIRLADVPLDMTFAEALGPDAEGAPDAYERLVMDVMRGNQTLFMRGDEVEAAWGWTDPIIAAWSARGEAPVPYEQGTIGPAQAAGLLGRSGRVWREIKA
ncbi:MAG: glucose-6-phosphate dehydrogenase [Pseudomonadota bacterium]